MNTNVVKVLDIREYFAALPQTPNGNALISESQREVLITRFDLLESLLQRAMPLLDRSKRIISNQAPGIPHVIETSLESLRVEIEEALTKIEEGVPNDHTGI